MARREKGTGYLHQGALTARRPRAGGRGSPYVELAAEEDLALPAAYELEQERRYGAAKFLLLRGGRAGSHTPGTRRSN